MFSRTTCHIQLEIVMVGVHTIKAFRHVCDGTTLICRDMHIVALPSASDASVSRPHALRAPLMQGTCTHRAGTGDGGAYVSIADNVYHVRGTTCMGRVYRRPFIYIIARHLPHASSVVSVRRRTCDN